MKVIHHFEDGYSEEHTFADKKQSGSSSNDWCNGYEYGKAEEREWILKFADDIVISAIGQVIEGDADLAVIYAGFRTKLKTKLKEVPADD